MSEFSEMLERVDLDDMIAYLIWGTDSKIEHIGTYEGRIKESYDKIFKSLEEMFPAANRQDDGLYGAILDFSITHSEVYLEMGLILGLQLYKNLEQKYQSFELTGLQSTINKNWFADREMENGR
ncbi:hypothetical protein SAMN02745136_03447 [Anaerocolumna jejuensis DSM 15929]|uniref:Uncharacterized protein n=1 Tax=Anaerocolumna jejuensis DSM 15929 TaxID=1121322 RepID=A0A1M6VPE1_9FIRM|nr:hypothetical protein [Anaerocolumna jejuensis]SHK83319.1 hypothetical protein SAMN02745136_03447 [Anaerocolumna jejuensis DSM 15929]